MLFNTITIDTPEVAWTSATPVSDVQNYVRTVAERICTNTPFCILENLVTDTAYGRYIPIGLIGYEEEGPMFTISNSCNSSSYFYCGIFISLCSVTGAPIDGGSAGYCGSSYYASYSYAGEYCNSSKAAQLVFTWAQFDDVIVFDFLDTSFSNRRYCKFFLAKVYDIDESYFGYLCCSASSRALYNSTVRVNTSSAITLVQGLTTITNKYFMSDLYLNTTNLHFKNVKIFSNFKVSRDATLFYLGNTLYMSMGIISTTYWLPCFKYTETT